MSARPSETPQYLSVLTMFAGIGLLFYVFS